MFTFTFFILFWKILHCKRRSSVHWSSHSLCITGVGEEETSDTHWRFELCAWRYWYSRPCCKAQMLSFLQTIWLESNFVSLCNSYSSTNQHLCFAGLQLALGSWIADLWEGFCCVQGNKKSAGFTDEERESFRKNFLHQGFVDTFRMQHPNAVAYTYWGYRTAARPKNRGMIFHGTSAPGNVMGMESELCWCVTKFPKHPRLYIRCVGGFAGWRLDYFLVSESLSKDVHDSYTIPDVGGSDHCPIGLILKT
jgi:hypothetical protein